MSVRAGPPAAISHCCTDEEIHPRHCGHPLPFTAAAKSQQLSQGAPGWRWQSSVPLQPFLGIKEVERSKTSSVL